MLFDDFGESVFVTTSNICPLVLNLPHFLGSPSVGLSNPVRRWQSRENFTLLLPRRDSERFDAFLRAELDHRR